MESFPDSLLDKTFPFVYTNDVVDRDCPRMDLSFLVDGGVLVHGMDTGTWWVTVPSVSSVRDVNSADS